MNTRLELAEGIQECLETVQDIKACNQEEDYLRKLDAKMDAAEKAQISSEMTTASLLTTGQMFLRLGLATVIVVGNSLVVNGDTSLFTYILFLIAASRLYDPLSGAMANMAELFSVQLQVNRLKEIEKLPGRNRRERDPYKRIRYYFRPCPVFLRKRQTSAAGCFVYRKAGTSHSISRPIWWRQKYRCKAGGKILSAGWRKNTFRRNRYCPTQFNHADEKLLYRFSRCRTF